MRRHNRRPLPALPSCQPRGHHAHPSVLDGIGRTYDGKAHRDSDRDGQGVMARDRIPIEIWNQIIRPRPRNAFTRKASFAVDRGRRFPSLPWHSAATTKISSSSLSTWLGRGSPTPPPDETTASPAAVGWATGTHADTHSVLPPDGAGCFHLYAQVVVSTPCVLVAPLPRTWIATLSNAHRTYE